MKNFNYRKRNLFNGPHLLGTILMLAGLFVTISPTFVKSGSSTEKVLAVGLITITVGLFIVFTYSGTVIDFTKKRFKEYSSIGGWKTGGWQALPNILKIKVISTSYIHTNTPNGISPTLSGKVTDSKILLYANSSKPIFVFEYSNEDKAVKQAKRLAAYSNADLILDKMEKG